MLDRDLCAAGARFERDRDRGLAAMRVVRQPRVLGELAALELQEPAVVRVDLARVLVAPVEQTVDGYVGDDLLRTVPRAPRAGRIEPDVDHVGRGASDQTRNGHIDGLHGFFPLVLKNASSWSSRSVQGGAGGGAHGAAARGGAGAGASGC